MQKLPFTQIIKTVSLEKEKYDELMVVLKKQGKTFSRWVREQIDKFLKNKTG
jgi:predicted DNA-binding protein